MAHSDAKSEEVDIEAQANLRRKSFESPHERHAGATDLASNSSDAKHEESSDAVVVVQNPKTRDPAFLVGFNDLDDPENPKVRHTRTFHLCSLKKVWGFGCSSSFKPCRIGQPSFDGTWWFSQAFSLVLLVSLAQHHQASSRTWRKSLTFQSKWGLSLYPCTFSVLSCSYHQSHTLRQLY